MRMRILHACKHFYPRVTGVTAYVEHLGWEHQAMGHEVAVASWGDSARCEWIHGLKVMRAKTGDQNGLVKIMRDYQPDVIHAHSIWDTTHLAAKVARSLARPYVVTPHGAWHLAGSAVGAGHLRDRLHWSVWRKKVLWPRLLRGAATVFVLNAQEEEDALAAGVVRERVRRIQSGVDLHLFHPDGHGMRPGDRLWPECFTVLFVGAMEQGIGIPELLGAAALLRDTHSQVRWLFCGDGPYKAEAVRQAGEAGLNGSAVFLGKVGREKMPELYRTVDVAVVPSHSDAFAAPLLEAMASGLPCLGMDEGAAQGIIADTRTGFLVPSKDSQALAEKVAWLAGHPDEAHSMGEAGRDRVWKEFSWAKAATRIADTYQLGMALAVILAVLAVCQPALAVKIAPLDVLTMVDPQSGLTVPDSLGGWSDANPVWDGKTIRLSAAGGETAAFQLVLLPDPQEHLEDIRIQVEMNGCEGWHTYRAWHIWNVPEVAVPLDQGGSGFDLPSRVPDERRATQDFRAWPTVVEIQAPRGQSPGSLKGWVRVSWKGGKAQFPVEMAVQPFALPDKPNFVLEMNSYGDYLRILPSDLNTFLDIHRLFRNFRCTFTLIPYRHDGTPLLDFLNPVLAKNGQPDFTSFDKALAGLFDGSSFADHQPLSHFILPLQAQWPAPLGIGADTYATRNVSIRQAFARHIRDKGWNATRFQEFHNENPEHGAKVPWRMDEPITIKDLSGHDLFLGYRDQACGEWPGQCPLRYRIDISQWQPIRQALKGLKGRVTDWSVSADPAFLDSEALGFFRRLGGQWILAYGELEGFQVQGKTTPWAVFPQHLAKLFLSGVDGYAQWQADRWQDKAIAGIAPELVPLFQANAAGARDFIWPGTPLGLTGAMPSLRLFSLREGLNLVDYVVLASQRRPDLADKLRQRLASLDGASAIYAYKSELCAILAPGGS